MKGATSFFNNTVTNGGNGSVLSICVGTVAQSPWIVEWPAGVAFYEGGTQLTGGPRILFSLGTQDKVVVASPQGAFNLNANGKHMLSNTMTYLMSLKAAAN